MALSDRVVLFALYNTTGGAEWERNDNWNTHAKLSTWSKVDVNDQGRVVKLSLSSTKLTGASALLSIRSGACSLVAQAAREYLRRVQLFMSMGQKLCFKQNVCYSLHFREVEGWVAFFPPRRPASALC